MAFREEVARRGLESPWDALILEQAGDASIAALVKAVIASESEWDPAARNSADPSVGLMQILVGPRGPYPERTEAELAEPVTNITLGTRFLRHLIDRYGVSTDAISAYNAGHPSRSASGYSNDAYVSSVLAYWTWYTTPPAATGELDSPIPLPPIEAHESRGFGLMLALLAGGAVLLLALARR